MAPSIYPAISLSTIATRAHQPLPCPPRAVTRPELSERAGRPGRGGRARSQMLAQYTNDGERRIVPRDTEAGRQVAHRVEACKGVRAREENDSTGWRAWGLRGARRNEKLNEEIEQEKLIVKAGAGGSVSASVSGRPRSRASFACASARAAPVRKHSSVISPSGDSSCSITWNRHAPRRRRQLHTRAGGALHARARGCSTVSRADSRKAPASSSFTSRQPQGTTSYTRRVPGGPSGPHQRLRGRARGTGGRSTWRGSGGGHGHIRREATAGERGEDQRLPLGARASAKERPRDPDKGRQGPRESGHTRASCASGRACVSLNRPKRATRSATTGSVVNASRFAASTCALCAPMQN
eukprot:6180911-Pleurochrysis_carterae.AAC.2